MARVLALVLEAVEDAAAGVFAVELAAGGHRAGHALGLLPAEALHRHRDVARGTAPRVAQHIALRVRAVLVLLTLAVLTTRMCQCQRRILRFVELTAETVVLRHGVLSIAVIAVGARPAVKSDDLLGNLDRLSLLSFLIMCTSATSSMLGSSGCGRHCFLLLVVVSVEFLDPLLNAAQVERLPALVAIPKRAPLVDRVVADQTLLSAFGQTLHQVRALLSQPTELLQEVLEVVFDECLVLGCKQLLLLFFVNKSNFFLSGQLIVSHIIKVPADVV